MGAMSYVLAFQSLSRTVTELEEQAPVLRNAEMPLLMYSKRALKPAPPHPHVNRDYVRNIIRSLFQSLRKRLVVFIILIHFKRSTVIANTIYYMKGFYHFIL